MARMVCGRCGNATATDSTYCPIDRWTLFTDAPATSTRYGAAIADIALPHLGGFLTRRRHESHRNHLQHQLQRLLEARVDSLEAQLESDDTNFEAHRTLGLLALLDSHWERAHAHLERAQALNHHDCQTHINYAIVLAQRGKVQPALELLAAAQQQWPQSPLVHFNLALVALQARRPEASIQAVDTLERLWFDNPAILLHYHDDALTVRGLALLQLERFAEARAALEAVARRTPVAASSASANGTPEAAEPADDAATTITIASVTEDSDNPNTRPVEATIMVLKTAPAGGPSASTAGAANAAIAEQPAEDPGAEVHHEGQAAVDAGLDLLQWQQKVTTADLLNNLAIAEAAQGETAAAIQHLANALQVEPGHTRVLNNLGVLAHQHGQPLMAFKFLDMARQIEEFVQQPEPTTFNHLGVVLASMGQLEESLEQLLHAGSHERAEFEVFYNLGRAFIEHGKPQRGVESLREAFHINPHHADVQAVLGAAYLLRGRREMIDEAVKHLKRALQLNPHHRIALADLAMAMIEMENDEGTQIVLHQALKTHPKGCEGLFLAALTTMEEGDAEHFAQAGAQFSVILGLRPDLTAARYNIALCQYLMGFLDTAAQQLADITRRDPSFSPAYYLIGTGHAVAQRFKEALAAWNTALRYEPMNIDLHCNIAFVYYRFNNWAEAIKHYLNAHRVDPGRADVLGALGICFAQAARHEKDRRESVSLMHKALRAFDQSLAINPNSPITHSNLGLAYYLQNQVEKSVHHWRIVAQLDSGYALRREEEQHRSYDDSIITMAPLNWRARIVRMAPALPAPHLRLVPGYNARGFRPAISDPSLRDAPDLRADLMRVEAMLAWMHLRT